MEFRIDAIRDRVPAADDDERDHARDALEALSRPRLTGTPGAAEVEAELRSRFEQMGYEVQELPFRFSSWPGRYGVPAIGAVYLLGVAAATLLLALGAPSGAAAALVAAALVIGVGAIFARRAIAGRGRRRTEGKNLLVLRPGTHPRYIIVAHRDTKSQPISTFLRVAAVVLAAFAWVALLLLAGIGALDPSWTSMPLVLGVAGLGGLGGALLAACRAGNASPGALDNATGLAALLGIAWHERERDDVAFLVTDAEELGLAGAWDAAGRLPPVDGIINLDGLDDRGAFRIVERFGWPRRRGLAPHLVAALLASAAALDEDMQRRDLPPGILVDHIPFARAGFPAVTLLRGGARSLRRVHRPDDTPDRLTGAGVALAVAVVTGALELLRARAVGSG